LDPITVDEADSHVKWPDTAVEKQSSIVRHTRRAVSIEVLKGKPDFAREHQVGHLKLPKLHTDAATEQIVVPKPRILDERLAVATLLSKDAVEVERDVVRQRRTRDQLDEVGRLEVKVRISIGGARQGIETCRLVTSLDECLGAYGERKRLGQCETRVLEIQHRLAPLRQPKVHRCK